MFVTVSRLHPLLEDAVDRNFLQWPQGSVDSTIDLVSNPTQIPDAFTKGDFPYGWSGHAAVGPFNGLSSFNSTVHAQNTDSLSQSTISGPILGIDRELYIGTILQQSAHKKFRYGSSVKEQPSDFFASVDPTLGAPGVNEMIKLPSYPKVSLMVPKGLLINSPGFAVGEQINAMSAYQNTIRPPSYEADNAEKGQDVFRKAGCISCHAGEAFTNHQIVSSAIIGTEPSRGKSFSDTLKYMTEPSLYTLDTPVPIPPKAKTLPVPYAHMDPEQLDLAFGWGDSPGGYKVKGLIGLRWSAP